MDMSEDTDFVSKRFSAYPSISIYTLANKVRKVLPDLLTVNSRDFLSIFHHTVYLPIYREITFPP